MGELWVLMWSNINNAFKWPLMPTSPSNSARQPDKSILINFHPPHPLPVPCPPAQVSTSPPHHHSLPLVSSPASKLPALVPRKPSRLALFGETVVCQLAKGWSFKYGQLGRRS